MASTGCSVATVGSGGPTDERVAAIDAASCTAKSTLSDDPCRIRVPRAPLPNIQRLLATPVPGIPRSHSYRGKSLSRRGSHVEATPVPACKKPQTFCPRYLGKGGSHFRPLWTAVKPPGGVVTWPRRIRTACKSPRPSTPSRLICTWSGLSRLQHRPGPCAAEQPGVLPPPPAPARPL